MDDMTMDHQVQNEELENQREEVQQDLEQEQTQEQIQQEQQQDEPFIRIKYNKEEMALDRERAIELAQKGMNYDKIFEKYESTKPVLSFVERMAQKNGMTVEQYLEAVQEWEKQEELNQLIQQNIPEDIAKEIMENRKFREQWEQERKELEMKQKQETEYLEFFENYPDIKPEDIPIEVWEYRENTGKSLTDAFIWHENKILKEKIAKLEQSINVKKSNEENAKASTGSVTGQGKPEVDFISKEEVEANKHDKNWIMKNLERIEASMKRW